MLWKVILLLMLALPTLALDNGLMRTPPMGWMSWGRFRCNTDCRNDPKNCISEALFVDMADRLVEDGWLKLGYKYLIIDDCWSFMSRDNKGRLMPDPIRFPNGIHKLAHYAHDRKLKLGIHANMGKQTCAGYPGTMLDQIETDAQTFADWEVDMLKFDGCYSNVNEQQKGFPLMSKALNATGRPIAYSCSWPMYRGGLPPSVNYSFLGEICNLWRNYDDIEDSWESVMRIVDWFFQNQADLQSVSGPGHWNDPDMLIIGNFGLNMEQSQAQMALWAIMAAPLIMSNDLRTLTGEARSILQNKAVIAINQDPLGIQGRRILQDEGHIEVFWRPLSKSASALVFLSRRTDMPYRYHSTLSLLNYTSSSYTAYDVFKDETVSLPSVNTHFTITINPSGVVMWYVYPDKSFEQTKETGGHPNFQRKYAHASQQRPKHNLAPILL